MGEGHSWVFLIGIGWTGRGKGRVCVEGGGVVVCCVVENEICFGFVISKLVCILLDFLF